MDENTDYNDFHSVKTAIANIDSRTIVFGISTGVLTITLGFLINFGVALITIFLIWSPIVLIVNSAYDSLLKAKGLDCKNCGKSLIIPLSQGKTYYQCKHCGTKPGKIFDT